MYLFILNLKKIESYKLKIRQVCFILSEIINNYILHKLCFQLLPFTNTITLNNLEYTIR